MRTEELNVINFVKANCKNCYRCIRVCPVKAIRIKNEQAEIINNACILCGNCLKECPQNAKTIKNDVYKIKAMIREGATVAVSLAPSYPWALPLDKPKRLISAIKKLGINIVQPTSLGAMLISEAYQQLIDHGQMKNIITTACPTICDMIEKYYPDLVPYMAPVVSPMIAHGRMLKKLYGNHVKVIFIGPCISKKREITDIRNDDAIDVAITFEELIGWLEEEGIVPCQCDVQDFDNIGPLSADAYPVPNGIISTLRFENPSAPYYPLSVDGIKEAAELFLALRSNKIDGLFVEIHGCHGGCLKGPGIDSSTADYLNAKRSLLYNRDRADWPKTTPIVSISIPYKKFFLNRSDNSPGPDEQTIRAILTTMGKDSVDKELNCGACGYNSCREKAIAVYKGNAQPSMCMPYMREKAESISNILIASTPNAILSVNCQLTIQEFNPAAERMFGLKRSEAIGQSVDILMDDQSFQAVFEQCKDLINQKMWLEPYGIVVEASFIYIKDQNLVMAILKDISAEEKQREQLQQLKLKTIDMAQKVIDKQMVVAQEIASLLGETTAETKVTLSKLKDIMLEQQ